MRGLLSLLLLVFFASGCAQTQRLSVKAPPKNTPFFQVGWAKNLDPAYSSGNLSMTVGGVASGPGVLYVGGLDGIFRALDVENGRELWKAQESRPIAAPALVTDTTVVYGTQGGRLVSRHPVSGDLVYAIDLGGAIESAPVLHDGRLLVYLRGHQIVCLDAQTGKIIWNYRRAVPVTVTLQRTTRPLVVGNSVIVGFADGYAGALSLQEGLLQWEQKLVDTQKFVDVDLNPLLVGGLVITGSPSGELKALAPQDGAVRRHYGESSLSHPLLRGENLVLGNADGEVVYLSLEGKVLKRAKVSKQPINQVLWWKDHLVVMAFGGRIAAIDPLSFREVGHFSLGHDQSAVFGEAALGEEGLGVLSSRNRLFFFK